MNLLARPWRRCQRHRKEETKLARGGGIPGESVTFNHELEADTVHAVTRSKYKVFSALAAPRLAGLACLHPVVVFQALPFLNGVIFGFHETVYPNPIGRICSKIQRQVRHAESTDSGWGKW